MPGAARGTPPGNAVAPTEARNALRRLVLDHAGDLTAVMPKHTSAEAFIGLGLAYVRRDPKLMEAVSINPGSLILALRHCAALGHMPIRGTYSLVPFNNKNAPGGKEIVGIEEYRGVIERMYRAGGVRAVKCEVVRDNDRCRWQATTMTLPYHEYDEYATDEARGPLKAVYAWAVMLDGTVSQVAWMNRSAVMKRKAVSRSGDAFWGGPWEEDMWKKTALHHLERYVPTSSEYRWEVAQSAAAAATNVPPASGGDDQDGPPTVEGEFVEDWPDARRPPDPPPGEGP